MSDIDTRGSQNQGPEKEAGFMGVVTCRFGPNGERIESTRIVELGYHDGTIPGNIGQLCVTESRVNCPKLFKCGPCPERLENGGEGSLSERIGATAASFLNTTTKPFSTAKAWVVSKIITFGMPK